MAMQDMNDQVQARLAKLDKFKEMGVEAYPHRQDVLYAPQGPLWPLAGCGCP